MIYFVRSAATGFIKIVQSSNMKNGIYKLRRKYGELELLGALDKDDRHLERLQLLFGGSRVDDRHTGHEWFYSTDEVISYIKKYATPITEFNATSKAPTKTEPQLKSQITIGLTIPSQVKQALETLALAKQMQEGSHRVLLSDIIRDALQEYLDARGFEIDTQITRGGNQSVQKGRQREQDK